MIADLQCRIMHDAPRCPAAFPDEAKKRAPDFIIQPGDRTFRPKPDGGIDKCDAIYRAYSGDVIM